MSKTFRLEGVLTPPSDLRCKSLHILAPPERPNAASDPDRRLRVEVELHLVRMRPVADLVVLLFHLERDPSLQ